MKYRFQNRFLVRACVAVIPLSACRVASPQTSKETFKGAEPTVTSQVTSQVTPQPQTVPAVSYVSVPFTPLPGLGFPVVRVRLNDRMTTDFVVDTGSTCFCIRPEIASKMDLKLRKMMAPAGSDPKFAGKEFEVVKLDHLNIGDAFDVHTEAVVTGINWASYPDSVGGIIGGNFFVDAKLAVLFDFEHQYIHMIDGGHLNPQQVRSMGIALAEGSSGIPVRSSSNGQLFYVPSTVRIEKQPGAQTGANTSDWEQTADLIVDSGSVRTKLAVAASPRGAKPVRHAVAALASGSVPVELYKVDSLEVGPQSAAQPETAAALGPFVCGIANSEIEQSPSIYALGIDFLSRFRVLIDYPGRKLYLTPVPHDEMEVYPTNASRENAQRSTDNLSIRPLPDGNWEVLALNPGGTFSAAGTHIGDVLLSANGIKLAHLLPDEVAALLTNDKKLIIGALRDGKPIVDLQIGP